MSKGAHHCRASLESHAAQSKLSAQAPGQIKHIMLYKGLLDYIVCKSKKYYKHHSFMNVQLTWQGGHGSFWISMCGATTGSHGPARFFLSTTCNTISLCVQIKSRRAHAWHNYGHSTIMGSLTIWKGLAYQNYKQQHVDHSLWQEQHHGICWNNGGHTSAAAHTLFDTEGRVLGGTCVSHGQGDGNQGAACNEVHTNTFPCIEAFNL